MYPTVFVICEHFSYEMIDTLIYTVRASQRYNQECDLQRIEEALESVVSPRQCTMHVVFEGEVW